MTRPVLEQWSGERLVYLSPRETCRTCGYPGPGARADVTKRELAHFAAIDARVPRHDGEPAREVDGVERWVVDTEACVPYFSTHSGCGVCIQVCPFNAKAFGGSSRDAFVSTMRRLDAGELRTRLTAALPAPRRRPVDADGGS